MTRGVHSPVKDADNEHTIFLDKIEYPVRPVTKNADVSGNVLIARTRERMREEQLESGVETEEIVVGDKLTESHRAPSEKAVEIIVGVARKLKPPHVEPGLRREFG